MWTLLVKWFAMAGIWLIERSYRRDKIADNFILHVEQYTGVDLVSALFADQKLEEMLIRRKVLRRAQNIAQIRRKRRGH